MCLTRLTGYRLEAPTASPLRSINLPEQLPETLPICHLLKDMRKDVSPQPAEELRRARAQTGASVLRGLGAQPGPSNVEAV